MDVLTVIILTTAIVLVVGFMGWLLLGIFTFIGSFMFLDKEVYLEDSFEISEPTSRKKK
jgi:hypothetical protein